MLAQSRGPQIRNWPLPVDAHGLRHHGRQVVVPTHHHLAGLGLGVF